MAVVPVFVSSTFRDFHGERDVLAGGVRERLDEQLKDLGCRVEIIDLRWGVDTVGVDEEEAARRVVDVCLQQVARARPLFVGLVGERVGYVPDGVHARWVADQAGVPSSQHVEGLSVTELEFGFAMLWDSAPAGEHVVVFRDLVGSAPTGWVDADVGRVAAFRDDVAAKAAQKGVAALRYEAVVDGATETVDLGAVVSDGERAPFENLIVDLLSGPVRRRAEHVIAASGSGWTGAERLFRDDHAVVVGRESLIDNLAAGVRSGGRSVLVGESGTGKSTILCAVEDRLHTDPGTTVVSVLLGASSTGASGRDLVLRLVEQLQPLTGHELTPPADADEDAFIQWWRDVVIEAETVVDGELVIVIDALDALSDVRAQSDVWPVRAIPPTVGLLCSTTNPNHAAVLESLGVDRVEVGELSPATAAEAAQSWAARSGRTLPASLLSIIGEASRSPLWVRLAVDLLADLNAEDFASIAAAPDQAAAIEQLLLGEARRLPPDTADLAGVFLGRVVERVGDRPAAQLLGVLATARSGVAPADLVALFPDDPDADLMVAVALRVLSDQLRSTDAAGRLTFAHAVVQNYAASLAGPDVHARIVGVLDATESWDDTDALDAIWHVIAASADVDEQLQLGIVLARAANHRPPGGELVLMRALDAHPGPGIDLVGGLDGALLGDEGMGLFVDAPGRVDRRYLHPRDRVGLSESVLGLARSRAGGDRNRQVATALTNLGMDCVVVGDVEAARGAFDEALELRRGLAQAQPDSVEAQRDLVVSLDRVGDLRQVRGDLDGAKTAFGEALALCRGLVRALPGSLEAQRSLSVVLERVGKLLQVRGELDAAEVPFGESLGLSRELMRSHPGSVLAQRGLRIALERNAGLREARGDLDGADALFGESLELTRAALESQPRSVQARRDLYVALLRVGVTRANRGDLDGAQAADEEALELARGLLRLQPGSEEAQRDLGLVLNDVGVLRGMQGDLDGAQAALEESLDERRRVVAQSGFVQAQQDVVVSLTNNARLQCDRGDPQAALPLADEAVGLGREVAASHPELVVVKSELVSALTTLANILDDLGDTEAAAEARAEVVELGGPLE